MRHDFDSAWSSETARKGGDGATLQEARSFHTRLRLTESQDAALRDACTLFGDVTRVVYRELKRGNADPRTELTARLGVQRWYIDSAMRGVVGLLQSAKSNRARYIAEYGAKAEACDRKANRETARLLGAKTAKKRHEQRMAIHGAKRRAARLRTRAARLGSSDPTICFGSRALFRQQPSVIDAIARRRRNDPERVYETHEQWLYAWREARSDELFSTGDAAVTGGNGLLKLESTDTDGVFNLHVTLPKPCQSKHGRKLVIENLRFGYGYDVIADALTVRERWGRNRQQKPEKKVTRGSIAVRIKRDGDEWRLIIQIARHNEAAAECGGFVGVDFNDGFLAVADVAPDGNCARRDLHRIEIPAYGGTCEQRRDAMAKAALEVVRIAVSSGRPAIEKLDFKRKKAELREGDCPRRARMLSALAFAQFRQMITTRAARNGIRVIEINPAFTSFMGRVRYAQQLGTDVHHAAAVVIARRAMNFSERCSPYAGREIRVPGNRGHVAVLAPEQMPGRHVWSWWGKCNAIWKRAHEAQLEMARKGQRNADPTMSPLSPSLASDAQFLAGFISSS